MPPAISITPRRLNRSFVVLFAAMLVTGCTQALPEPTSPAPAASPTAKAVRYQLEFAHPQSTFPIAVELGALPSPGAVSGQVFYREGDSTRPGELLNGKAGDGLLELNSTGTNKGYTFHLRGNLGDINLRGNAFEMTDSGPKGVGMVRLIRE